jgi:hypothetical protein
MTHQRVMKSREAGREALLLMRPLGPLGALSDAPNGPGKALTEGRARHSSQAKGALAK